MTKEPTIPKLDQLIERIHELNSKIYRLMLMVMTTSQLNQEFNDKIGGELNEFENMINTKGRLFVIDYLCDSFDVKQFERYKNG